MDEYLGAVTLKLLPQEQGETAKAGLERHFRWWGKAILQPDDRPRRRCGVAERERTW